MTLNNKNEKNDWGNVHGVILFLGIKDVFDDFKQQKRKKKDWSKCLGLPVTGYGPAFRKRRFTLNFNVILFPWPFNAMVFKLFTQYRPRDRGAKKVRRNPMHDWIPRYSDTERGKKRENSKNTQVWHFIINLYVKY